MRSLVVWLPIIVVLVIYMARVLELRTKRNTVAGAVHETLTLRLFVLAGTLMLFGSVTEYFWRGERWRWETLLAGLGCALGSILIRRRAIAALGEFWSLHVEIRENHRFVRSGPFRWLRHPTYFSMILELLAGGLILNAPYSLLTVSLLFAPVLWLRLKLEEAALLGKFGEAYQDYRRSTPALFPYKWPRSR